MCRDVPYDLLVPPLGLDFYHMTKAQAGENFTWFLAHIPERMEYMRQRCAVDLRIPPSHLDFSSESLVLIWRWFLKTARMVPTPKEELARMREGAKIFGPSYINKKVFSVATVFIMRDIGIYFGETYIRNFSPLYWSYYTKPKNEVSAKKPVIAGFWAWVEGHPSAPATVDPIGAVEGAAAKFYDKTQTERDLYDAFTLWHKHIPHCDKHPRKIPLY